MKTQTCQDLLGQQYVGAHFFQSHRLAGHHRHLLPLSVVYRCRRIGLRPRPEPLALWQENHRLRLHRRPGRQSDLEKFSSARCSLSTTYLHQCLQVMENGLPYWRILSVENSQKASSDSVASGSTVDLKPARGFSACVDSMALTAEHSCTCSCSFALRLACSFRLTIQDIVLKEEKLSICNGEEQDKSLRIVAILANTTLHEYQ